MSDLNQNPERDALLDQATEALRTSAVPSGPPAELVASTVNRLNDAAISLTNSPDAVRLAERKERMLRIARYSSFAAAASVAAVLFAWWLVLSGGSQVAFADVLQNIQNADSVTCVNTQKLPIGPEMKFTWYVERDRLRMENPQIVTMIGDMQLKKTLQLNHGNKSAILREMPSGKPAGPFANPLDGLKNAKAEDAQFVREEQLDGAKVLVYRLDKLYLLDMKGEGTTTVWVNAKSELPVKITVESSRVDAKRRELKTYLAFDDFRWNEPLDPRLFSLEVPEGYRLIDEKDFQNQVDQVQKAASGQAESKSDDSKSAEARK
jgi:outer membrane lipoprotein-sorting protein